MIEVVDWPGRIAFVETGRAIGNEQESRERQSMERGANRQTHAEL